MFTISRADRTISYTTDQLALENDAMGPIANTPHETTVVKVGKSNTETKLAGAEFILKSQKGYVLLKDGSFDGYVQEEEKASRFTTDENGAFVIKRLPAGTYTLVEKTAPSGYKSTATSHPSQRTGQNTASSRWRIRRSPTAAETAEAAAVEVPPENAA